MCTPVYETGDMHVWVSWLRGSKLNAVEASGMSFSTHPTFEGGLDWACFAWVTGAKACG